ncbi:hypothetical protein [Streptomyces glaucescens]
MDPQNASKPVITVDYCVDGGEKPFLSRTHSALSFVEQAGEARLVDVTSAGVDGWGKPVFQRRREEPLERDSGRRPLPLNERKRHGPALLAPPGPAGAAHVVLLLDACPTESQA